MYILKALIHYIRLADPVYADRLARRERRNQLQKIAESTNVPVVTKIAIINY